MKRKPIRRVTRQVFAVAAASGAEQPQAWIESLKGGELSWGIRCSDRSASRAVARCIREAKALKAACLEMKTCGEPT